MIPVRDIKLNNKEFISILDEYKDIILQKNEEGIPLVKRELYMQCEDEKPEDWLSDEYMHSVIKQGRAHDGFPKVLKGFGGMKFSEQDMRGKVIKQASADLNRKLIEFLSCKNNALNATYPPGSFISWHNNANASGYNIIITYSETGEGWFDYWNIDKKERVRMQDVPGWQAKMTYFGSYDEPENLCYHAAYTDCYRISVAFVFANAENFWQEVIEDLEDPC
tara:strand:+ start:1525 stop:2190 length:666 start_codon:yes stop_codon:yes gene_type:complete